MRGRRIFVVLASLALLPSLVLAYTSPGKPTGYVNDFANILTVEQRQELEQKLAAFEVESSNEIVVTTVVSLDEDTIENFAVELYKEWVIGKQANDNGVLLLIAPNEREVRIEVGYGLEGALPDATSAAIIRERLLPAFRAADYYTGVDGALQDILSATKGEYTPAESGSKDGTNAFEDIIGGFLQFGFFLLLWLSAILGRSKSWWAGGVVGAVIAIIIGLTKGFVVMGFIALGILIPLGLLFDFLVSRGYQRGRAAGHIPWWVGGGRGGFGGGGFGGGFGGFGGGSSGGGGASGRW